MITKLFTAFITRLAPDLREWGIEPKALEMEVGAYVKFILAALLLLFVVSLLIGGPLLGLAVALAAVYPLFKLVAVYVAGRHLRPLLEAEKYVPLVINELKLSLKITNSLHKALSFVALANYPVISKKFRRILRDIDGGLSPEKAIILHAKHLPPTLREFMITLAEKSIKGGSLDLKVTSDKARSAYLDEVRKLRTRVAALFAISFLLPIPFLLAMLVRGVIFALPFLTTIYVFALSTIVSIGFKRRVSSLS